MQFSLALVALFAAVPATVMALPEPAFKSEPTSYSYNPEPALAERNTLEARARILGTVQVDGLRYRTCPRTTCTTIGTYSKGDSIIITCFTRTDTTVIEGDA